MSAYNLAVFAARLGDLLAEARAELDEDELDDLFVIAANACAAHIANRIEERHHGGES